MIYQQSRYDYNINEVIIILNRLRSNNQLLNLLIDKNFDYLLRKNLIEVKLIAKNINFTDEDANQLYEYLQFRIDLLEKILESISGENKIASIIQFSYENEKFEKTLQDLMSETTEKEVSTKSNLIKDQKVKKLFKPLTMKS